jgi:hypothetical protein
MGVYVTVTPSWVCPAVRFVPCGAGLWRQGTYRGKPQDGGQIIHE